MPYDLICHECATKLRREHLFQFMKWDRKGECAGCGAKRVPKVQVDHSLVVKLHELEEERIEQSDAAGPTENDE